MVCGNCIEREAGEKVIVNLRGKSVAVCDGCYDYLGGEVTKMDEDTYGPGDPAKVGRPVYPTRCTSSDRPMNLDEIERWIK